jgi:hypothetical protein
MKKKLLWASALLVVIIVTIMFLSARYAGRVIEPFVRSFLEENKPLNHRIEFGRLKVNLIKSTINIRDLRIYPDSSLVKSENVWWEFNVSTVKLTDFSLWDLLFNKKLSIGDFLFLNPLVEIHFPILQPDKVREASAVLSPKKIKPTAFKSFSLQKILISTGNLKIFRDTVLLANSPDISFIAQQITLEKTGDDKQFVLKYGDVRLYISDINLNPESSLYEVKLGKFTLSRSDSTIILESLKFTPLFDKTEFSKKLIHQDDRIDLNINRISITSIGLERWLAGQPLEISKVLIDSVDADIYRDRNVAMDINRFPPFYNESFLKINYPLVLDTLMVTNSNIKYGELAEGDEKAGVIQLESFNLSTYGLSVMPTDSTLSEEMRIFLDAKVMGEGNLNVELALPLKGNLHEFTCNGSVGTMKLSPLNDMMGPSMNMNFKDGRVNRMTFDFSANDNNSKGWMEFLYEGLDVSLINKDSGKEKGFLSKVAKVVMLSDNPAPGKDLVTVEIGFERDKNKGIINYLWKTIQSGMTRTILTQKKYQINRKPVEEEVKNDMKKVK